MIYVIGGVVIVGAFAYYLGIFDRPEFTFHETLVEDSSQSYLYAILALSTEKKISAHIERLLTSLKIGIEKSIPDADQRMKNSAILYGSSVPDGKLSIGLFFDDPCSVPSPRWCAGWAIDAQSSEDLEKFITDIKKNSDMLEVIRIVRLGMGSNVLRGRIPVRTMLSLMIAPIIQWDRAYRTMKDGGYTAFHDRNNEDCTSPALEIYMTNEKDRVVAMDYIVLMGDVSVTWNDTYPSLPVIAE